MINVRIGDLFQSNATTLVNTVNCVGVMGKGVAAEFRKRYPAMFEDYVVRCRQHQVRLGEPYIFRDILGTTILNFPTKDHWRSSSRLDDIVRGLDYLVAHAAEWNLQSIAIPPLGCGNGGLEWSLVGPLMVSKLSVLAGSVEIFAPYGTPQAQLTMDFLKQPVNTENVRGRQQQKLKPEWLTLLEVLYELGKQPYANPVGRTTFQKIAYVMTEQGVETGFRFGRGSYGPFSAELQEAIKVFANTNLIDEQTLGRMTAIRVGSAYPEYRQRHADLLSRFQRKIDKTVDLFSRIKTTEQAEEVATVLFASRQLKQQTGHPNLTENELFGFILGWKKVWNTESKRQSLTEAIRHLEMLSWMKLQHSASLDTVDWTG